MEFIEFEWEDANGIVANTRSTIIDFAGGGPSDANVTSHAANMQALSSASLFETQQDHVTQEGESATSSILDALDKLHLTFETATETLSVFVPAPLATCFTTS